MDLNHNKIFIAVQLSVVLIGMFFARPTYSRHTLSEGLMEDKHNTQINVTAPSQITIGNRHVEGYSSKIDDITKLSQLFQKVLKQQPKLGYRHQKQRAKRHSHHSKNPFQQTRTFKSCPIKSAITNSKEAVDMFGNTVAIYPSIHIGKIAVNQYFHETWCDKEACQCGGVDGTRYHSSCETNYSFTYARVVQQGEIGWTKILVRSGCSCVLRKRNSLKRSGNIMDSI